MRKLITSATQEFMKEPLVRLIKELSAHLDLEELQNYHTGSGLETEVPFSLP